MIQETNWQAGQQRMADFSKVYATPPDRIVFQAWLDHKRVHKLDAAVTIERILQSEFPDVVGYENARGTTPKGVLYHAFVPLYHQAAAIGYVCTGDRDYLAMMDLQCVFPLGIYAEQSKSVMRELWPLIKGFTLSQKKDGDQKVVGHIILYEQGQVKEVGIPAAYRVEPALERYGPKCIDIVAGVHAG